MWITIEKTLINLPTPRNLTFFWNLGSLLGLRLIIQIFSGIFLAIHYKNDINLAFFRIDEIYRNIKIGWLIRLIHRNGARIFFICIYIHIGRGIYFNRFITKKKTWISGSLIFIILIATAFLGYVLPWGQISLWGATVITNLFSAIPFIGTEIVFWLWGGFSVEAPTLRRFFAFHYLLPFILTAITLIHLITLHEFGSSNPIGFNSNLSKIKFYPYYIIKDILGMLIYLLFLTLIIFFKPWVFADPENFILANSITTPVHIQPEWYFLFAYTILRAIPRKLGGVLALFLSVIILFILPVLTRKNKINNTLFNPPKKLFFWILINIFIILTWIGAKPARGIYVLFRQYISFFYFFILRILDTPDKLWWAILD